MKISPTKVAFAALLLAGAAIPALGQDTPESLLPPGFDEPSAPAPAPASAPQPTRATPTPTAAAPDSGADADAPEVGATDSPRTDAPPVDLSQYEIPEYAKRTLNRVGAVAWGNTPFPGNAFGRSDGRYLTRLMRGLDAPVASRWASIALRRALMSRVQTPANVNGADFAAERAWLLIRMGEPIAARAVVQDVDIENFTPHLFEVAMQSALASADPAALCPLATSASQTLKARGWALAQAMCAGLSGQPSQAGMLLDRARRGTPEGDIDNLLAEKVLGIGAKGRRAVTIEWNSVDRLSAWRWGLATATREEIPDSLYATVGPQVRYWYALSPVPDARNRVASAELAAAQGVFSNAGLVDLYSEIEAQGESASGEVATARDLRAAYTGDAAARVAAMNTLWNDAGSARRRYARLVLTARAAARIAPNGSLAADVDQLIASMLSAGLDAPAMKWRDIAARGSDGWAMLALADPAPNARADKGDFDAYRGMAGKRKAQIVLAGLAGLGRLDADDARRLAASLEVPIGAANSWTQAIDRAGARGDAGTVALLAAVGMQSRNWGSVTPEGLFHIVAALRACGMNDYARMIAVEAVTRAG